MRLIDADMCIEELTFALWECPNEYCKCFNNFKYAKRFAEHTIKNIPTVQPEQTGEWNFVGDDIHEQFECTNCKTVYSAWQLNIVSHRTDAIYPKYCPNCGARMLAERR